MFGLWIWLNLFPNVSLSQHYVLEKPSFPQWSEMHLCHIINNQMRWTYFWAFQSVSLALSLRVWVPYGGHCKGIIMVHMCANGKKRASFTVVGVGGRDGTPLPLLWISGRVRPPLSAFMSGYVLNIPACGHYLSLGSCHVDRWTSG